MTKTQWRKLFNGKHPEYRKGWGGGIDNLGFITLIKRTIK